MKSFLCLIMTLLVVCSCTDQSVSSQAKLEQEMKKHQEIVEKSILTDFVNYVNKARHAQAFPLLHPKLAQAWTETRFVSDWKKISALLSSNWNPVPIDTTRGNSEQGPYLQAIYTIKIDSQRASLDLVSMRIDGKDKLVRVFVRVPAEGKPSKAMLNLTNSFVEYMRLDEIDKARGLFSAGGRAKVDPETLKKIRPLLGNSKADILQHFYKLCANTIWYDAVLINSKKDPATHLELIISQKKDTAEILYISFKGRLSASL